MIEDSLLHRVFVVVGNIDPTGVAQPEEEIQEGETELGTLYEDRYLLGLYTARIMFHQEKIQAQVAAAPHFGLHYQNLAVDMEECLSIHSKVERAADLARLVDMLFWMEVGWIFSPLSVSGYYELRKGLKVVWLSKHPKRKEHDREEGRETPFVFLLEDVYPSGLTNLVDIINSRSRRR